MRPHRRRWRKWPAWRARSGGSSPQSRLLRRHGFRRIRQRFEVDPVATGGVLVPSEGGVSPSPATGGEPRIAKHRLLEGAGELVGNGPPIRSGGGHGRGGPVHDVSGKRRRKRGTAGIERIADMTFLGGGAQKRRRAGAGRRVEPLLPQRADPPKGSLQTTGAGPSARRRSLRESAHHGWWLWPPCRKR